MKKNYFKTILIAIAILTGFSVTTMAQTQTTIAKMGSTATWPKVKANWTGDGYIKVNSVPLTKNELKEIITTERGSMTGIPINFRGIEVYAVGNVKLTHLYMTECSLGYIDVSKCTDLLTLDCSKNRLTSLDVSACKDIVSLHCEENELTTLNLQGCNSLSLTAGLVASKQNISVSIKDGQYFNPISYARLSGTENIRINGMGYAKDSPLPEPAEGNKLIFRTETTVSSTPSNVFSGTITLVGYTPPIPVDVTQPIVSDKKLTITNVLGSSFKVSWTKASDEKTLPNNIRYEVWLSEDNDAFWIINGTGALDIDNYTVTGLDRGYPYWINIRAVDEAGNGTYYTQSYVRMTYGVTISQTALSLTVGETGGLAAEVNPADATNKTVTWSSSNTAVATVDASGVVTAKAAGSATITVTTEAGGYTALCVVIVTPEAPISIPVTGIEVSPAALSLDVGKKGNLFISITPSTATNKDVTWKSSNDAIATVNASGEVTAKAEGTAVIAVTTVDGGHMAMCNVAVKSPVDNGTIAGNTFNVYPNPTDGELTIEGVAPGGIVRLYSVTGSLIASYTAHEGVLKIDLSSLKQGLYLINYEGKTMKVIRK